MAIRYMRSWVQLSDSLKSRRAAQRILQLEALLDAGLTLTPTQEAVYHSQHRILELENDKLNGQQRHEALKELFPGRAAFDRLA